MSRAVLERAATRPHAIRRIRLLRVAGIPLVPARRSRLLTPAIRCPNALCKCDEPVENEFFVLEQHPSFRKGCSVTVASMPARASVRGHVCVLVQRV